ncbi:MAG: hypothetical protein H6654_13490 [Ardenticatenaceae bacterium]|nr:hypothetical protein [Anaerolineales bacterium]MCB8941539.1 hypothetical protein [Ardenticatenaceae bacterium]MCB8974567.1 hypothetical protein [Ardenticatenaceae bacterium]
MGSQTKIALVVGATISVCMFGILGLIARSCLFLNCVPERAFNVLDLGLPSGLFPSEATGGSFSRPSTSEGAFETGFLSYNWLDGHGRATYEVWRFRTPAEASRAFTAVSGEGIYLEEKDFFYRSVVADEFAVGCGRLENFPGYRCNLGARYQEYAINFQSIIDPEMSMEMFNEVVIFIDEQMEKHLYEE